MMQHKTEEERNAVAIIPARGGSQRIPRKNIKLFHGLPLIAYSIKAAQDSALFDKIIVSTDDEEIAMIAKEHGADVPFMRPVELSDDITGTGPVITHALKWLSDRGLHYDYVCTIYATAPFLQIKTLKEGFERLRDSTATHAFSATSMPYPIQRTFKLTDEGRCEMFWPEHYKDRSQDLEDAYQDAGQFYWSKSDRPSDAILFAQDSIPIILPRYRVQDIDTQEDWERAEMMYVLLKEETTDEKHTL